MTIFWWPLAIARMLSFGCSSAPSTPAARQPPSVDVTGKR